MSEVKVNKISPRTNCGTVQLGDSGDTITIPSGATINNQGTATNFGPTGSVSWQTTVKTSGFTATAGEGYFVDTSSGGFTVNLPAGTAGAVVGFKDYANTFDTGNLTLDLNGTDKAAGSTTNPKLIEEGIAVTLVFIDSTKGWLVTDSGLQSEANQAEFIAATGGTVTTVCTNFKVHTFTGPGTFCVSAAGNAAGSNTVDYLVIAGGGGGGFNQGGGGGAGGYRESSGAASGSYAKSPLGACVAALPVSATAYPIVVGAAGAGSSNTLFQGADGSVSTFSTITSTGGGGGGSEGPGGPGAPQRPGADGGSGGGGSGQGQPGTGGSGNTPPVSPPQGTDGGINNTGGPGYGGGGGGGATAVGSNGLTSKGGNGGAGATSSINATPTARSGGGGGGSLGDPGTAPGGSGGGGDGAGTPGRAGSAGTTNTGGGGGAGSASPTSAGYNGGSGIVIIRYKFQ